MKPRVDHIKVIDADIAAKRPYTEVARKVFLTYPTHAFIGEEESQYEIFNEVALFLGVPIICVQVAGSAKVGMSMHKKTIFVPGSSDLDLSVINAHLFSRYQGIVLNITDGYKDQSKFPVPRGVSVADQYLKYLAKGIFRPDLMPYGNDRANWFEFFGTLSTKYHRLFQSISVAVYLSECSFEWKQRSAISSRADIGI